MEPAGPEHRVTQTERGKALIDHPGKGGDPRPQEIALERGRFVNRGRFGQRHDEHLRELGVTQPREEFTDRFGHVAQVAEHVAVIGFGRIEEEEGMPRRGRVEHDKAILAAIDGAGEGPKDRDLFGARGTQILFEEGFPLRIEIASGSRHHFRRIVLRLRRRVDATHRQVRDPLTEGQIQVSRRVGGREVDPVPEPRQGKRHLRRDRGLTDAPLAHREDDPVASA